jgi:hypothetical protein
MLSCPLKHNYTALVWGQDITTCCYKVLPWEEDKLLLRFPMTGPSCNAKVSHNRPFLHHIGSSGNHEVPLTILWARLPLEVSLISKQVVLYWTRGGTNYSGGFTPKNRSLADSSKTNHKSWRSQPYPPYNSLLKPQHQTIMVNSHQEGWKTTTHTVYRKPNQHLEGWKIWTMTHDCKAKQKTTKAQTLLPLHAAQTPQFQGHLCSSPACCSNSSISRSWRLLKTTTSKQWRSETINTWK